MRRSMLFIPGNNPGMLQTAEVFDADSIIFDLEDAISISEKDSARNLVKYFLTSFNLGKKEVVIRINGLDTLYYNDDLDAIVNDNIDSIMVPKANIEELNKLSLILDKYEEKRLMKKKIKLIPIIELASSLLEVEDIAKLKRVDGILLGAEDLTSDMEVERTKEATEIFYPRAKIAFACISEKIDAIDTPYTNTLDEEGLYKDCQLAKSIGLNAKACIHPNQVDLVNEVFSPSKKQIEYAKRVIDATLQNENKGAFSLDGKMIDKPIIERCKKVLEKAKRFGLLR